MTEHTGDISATENPYESGMVETLRRTVAVLGKRNIPYWIDCGTLLGLIRDQRIIPWDEDVELGAWTRDKSLFDACLPDFLEHGLVITVDKPKKLGLALSDGQPYKFRILFYDVLDGHAVRGGLVGGSFLGRVVSYIGNLLDDALCPVNPGVSKMRTMLIQCTRFVPHPLIHFSLTVLKRLPLKARPRFKISERLFRETSPVEFYGFDVLVPSAAEEYLAFRYGDGWDQPTRYWIDHADVADMRHK